MKQYPLLLLILLLWNTPIFAANLMVTPTKVDINPKHKSVALKIMNRQNKAVKLQVFIKAWSQDENGKTLLGKSSGLIIYPKLLTIEAQGERPVRVAYQGTWPNTEQAFRLFIDELPPKNTKQGIGVVMPVHLSIPVFLKNNSASGKPSLNIFKLEKTPRYLKIGIHNTGKQHFRINQLQAQLFDKRGKALDTLSKAGWYVLPDGHVFFSLPWKQKICKKARRAKVALTIQNQTTTHALSLSGKDCQ
ncbi:fimbria/pilus periplasmic chaperone [Candidatus Venteria ishoeyi]|uniref:fimbrial biogenesis chaperone n=1 Tax=Candidatus Venteria ishoeyi TaxID=1899563 RepID=UPI0025A6735B|nr:fimbria/pilus periplasmic chaperone [Candidatus Venteria ishoeyi]MDM8546359.1 fimbria/pilus periplasmic chaperone [Candidatus Venteria ishoeyi]